MSKGYWDAPLLWKGETAVLLGGGPSLTKEQVQHATSSGARVLAINDAYRLAPNADLLYFCDDKWWGWHGRHLGGWKNLIVRLHAPRHDFGDPRIKVLRRLGKEGLAPEQCRDGITHASNSGYQAICVAVLLGAKRLVLLGYDMHAPLDALRRPQTHWFGDHPIKTEPSVYFGYAGEFHQLLDPLAKRGVEVVNCTPGTHLHAFPKARLEEALPVNVTA